MFHGRTLETAKTLQQYIDVKNRAGKLLFRYDPVEDKVEIKLKGAKDKDIIELSQYKSISTVEQLTKRIEELEQELARYKEAPVS